MHDVLIVVGPGAPLEKVVCRYIYLRECERRGKRLLQTKYFPWISPAPFSPPR